MALPSPVYCFLTRILPLKERSWTEEAPVFEVPAKERPWVVENERWDFCLRGKSCSTVPATERAERSTEALVGSDVTPLKPEHETIEASRDLGFRIWHQQLTVSRVGAVVYYDEGNGESRLK